jgi:hypothetical protein
MDNKLSELSKPVMYVVRTLDGSDASVKNYKYTAPKGFTSNPLYSQEYVSALLADNEAKDKRIAELEEEPTIKHMRSVEEALISATDRVSELEAKLAQPVSSGYKLPADWRLDESTGAKILMYKDCSVIEDQQAEYVLSLIQAAAPVGGN